MRILLSFLFLAVSAPAWAAGPLVHGHRGSRGTVPENTLAAFEAERARAPNNQDRVVDVVDAHAWVADCLVKLGRPRDAYAEREGAANLLARTAAKAYTNPSHVPHRPTRAARSRLFQKA